MEENTLKKQSFLHGAAILALATAIVKIIGACYKIPLVRIIGNQGYTYFLAAYDIYSVLLTVSTAGLPVAMSRMISTAQTLGNHAQIRRIYRASLYVFLTIGVIGTSGMLLFAHQLANFMETPNAWISIAALGPAVIFVCAISSFRGFFQGQSNMTPTAISQVMEAMCKLIIGLLLAWFLIHAGYGSEYAAGGAIIGVTIGIILSFVYLCFQHRKVNAVLLRQENQGSMESMSLTMKTLLAIAIPITLGSASLQIINLIDSKLVVGRLVHSAGFDQDTAETLRGIYGACQTIFNMPSAFITPITISVIPSITEHLTRGDAKKALLVEESASRITGLFSLPCALGLAVLSSPILEMLYGYTGETLTTGTPLLAILGFCVFFNCIMMLTNAVMQAHGHVVIPVIHMIIGGLVKIVVNYILVGQRTIAITGAPIGTLCCCLVITTLNLIALRRKLTDVPRVMRSMVKPLIASVIMAGFTAGAYLIAHAVLPSQTLACLCALVVAVAVYFAAVIALHAITYDDCMLLPKGEKIAKLLRIPQGKENTP